MTDRSTYLLRDPELREYTFYKINMDGSTIKMTNLYYNRSWGGIMYKLFNIDKPNRKP